MQVGQNADVTATSLVLLAPLQIHLEPNALREHL